MLVNIRISSPVSSKTREATLVKGPEIHKIFDTKASKNRAGKHLIVKDTELDDIYAPSMETSILSEQT